MSKKFIHRRAFCPRGHSMADAYLCRDGRGYEHRHCRGCRTETLERWRLANRDKIQKEVARYEDKRRERAWRFRMWENAHLRTEYKEIIRSMAFRAPHITNFSELTSPIFIFELHGKKQRETLNEPLPKW